MLRLRKVHRSVDAESSVDVSEINGVRNLHIGNATVQSAMQIRAPFELELRYTRAMMCYLLFNAEADDVLVLGLGGGSVPKYIHYHLPKVTVRAVEIDPRVIRIARSHFEVPEDDARFSIIEGDGALYLREHPATTSVLMLDAYGSDGIPSELCTQEFFDSCSEALKDDGICLFNLWGSDRKFDVHLQRIERSFDDRVLVLPTGRPGNVVVMAFRRAPADLRWASLRERARAHEQYHRIEFLDFVEKLREHNPNTGHRLLMEA